jgi:hypothetical protein
MSRNLGRTDCNFCGGVVKLEERPRLINEDEAGPYYVEYKTAKFANASCVDCNARYLAWCEGLGFYGHFARESTEKHPFNDLSHRAAFNDEPAAEDMPDFVIERGVVKKTPWPLCPGGCGTKKTLFWETDDRVCIRACSACHEMSHATCSVCSTRYPMKSENIHGWTVSEHPTRETVRLHIDEFVAALRKRADAAKLALLHGDIQSAIDSMKIVADMQTAFIKTHGACPGSRGDA